MTGEQEPTGRPNAELSAALAEARESYVARNPASLARFIEAALAMPGGNTRSVLHYAPFPLGLAGGAGCRIHDLDGHEYVDFLGEYTAGLFGHSHPQIRAAVDRALDGGINLGGHTMLEARFARAVCDRFPAVERVRFTNSGTEANLMALAAARAFTGRDRILAFEGGYHGGLLTFANSSASRINAPFDIVLGQYNDRDATAALIAANAGRLAAIILEPMLGGGGCIPAELEFLRFLRQAASDVGALLILDEVMTSRLAPQGWGAKQGVRPDLMTLGKYVGGGMSFGAFGGREEIMDLFDPRRTGALPHAGTFNNNVLTMSAGLVGLTEVYTPEAAIALNRRGDDLRARLNELCQRAEAPLQFTGIGSMIAVHPTARVIRTPADASRGDQRLKELLFFDLLTQGIWIAKRGMIVLSLPIGEAECDHLARAVDEFLAVRRSLLEAARDAETRELHPTIA
jgi:glutamate-1-semialdehyde 2,1-aminomutase